LIKLPALSVDIDYIVFILSEVIVKKASAYGPDIKNN